MIRLMDEYNSIAQWNWRGSGLVTTEEKFPHQNVWSCRPYVYVCFFLVRRARIFIFILILKLESNYKPPKAYVGMKKSKHTGFFLSQPHTLPWSRQAAIILHTQSCNPYEKKYAEGIILPRLSWHTWMRNHLGPCRRPLHSLKGRFQV